MNIILFDQTEAYRQIESGLRCPVCGDQMEVVQHGMRRILECQSSVTVLGGLAGTASGG